MLRRSRIFLKKCKLLSNGVHPSPLGIGLVIFLLVGSLYYLLMWKQNTVSMKQLLVAGIDIAERGGVKVKQVHDDQKLYEQSKGKTKEGVNDPLTQGDLQSHQAMMETFQQTFPDIKVISEEKKEVARSSFVRKSPLYNKEVDSIVGDDDDAVDVSDVTVWIDPLDATKEYTENLLQYVTTMVCVAVRGIPTIGIIHKPFEDKTYWSWVRHGSNIEDESKQDGQHSVIVSLSHSGDVKEKATQAFGEGVHITPAGGAGYKSLALFNGKASVYVHTTLIKKWDICSGSAILRHAGGRMSTLKGKDIDFSANSDPKNDKGLIAALHNHQSYVAKLGTVL